MAPVHWLPSTRKKWIMLGIRLIILALVIWGISRAIHQAGVQLHELEERSALNGGSPQKIEWWQFNPAWVVAAASLYLIGMLPMGLFWYSSLRALGQKPTLGRALAAFYMGHLGKYVPGKALVVVIRASVIRSKEVSATVAAVTVFIESLTMMASGAFLAAIILAFQSKGRGLLLLLAIGLMLGAGLPTLPPIFRRLVRTLRIAKAHEEIDRLLEGLRFRLLFWGWLGDMVGWLFIGASLLALMQALPVALRPDLSLGHLPQVVASTSLAMVAGFITPIPGGLGVREWILHQLMALRYGEIVSILASISLRIVWLMAEVFISIILYIAFREKGFRNHPPNEGLHPKEE